MSAGIGSAMSALAPAFTVASTSFGANLPTDIAKAGYAALTGSLTSGAGMLVGDSLDETINGSDSA